MIVGVIADTHDNLPMARRALELFAERGVEVILHAGDFVAPFALKVLLSGGIPLTGVFGNNDGERAGLLKLCQSLHREPHRFELDGRTVVLAHRPEALRGKPARGAELLVHGHTHRPLVQPGPPLVLNPGEACGWLSGRCTAAVVDLAALRAELLDLGEQETVAI